MMLMPVSFRVPTSSAAKSPSKAKAKPSTSVASPLLFAGTGWRKAGVEDHYYGRSAMNPDDWRALHEATSVIISALRSATDPKAIQIVDHLYSLTRKETCGGTSTEGGVRDFDYELKRHDGKVTVRSGFTDHTPQNYDRTTNLSFVNEEKRVDYFVYGYYTHDVAHLRAAFKQVFRPASII